MFPWKVAGKSLKAYAPSPDPLDLDADAMTLDFSHASLSGRDSLEVAMAMGDRLRHIHLCDGAGSIDEGMIFDEHLLPGRGTQPVAETLAYLAKSGWSGSVVAEVNLRKTKDEQTRLDQLVETVAFAREHLGQNHAIREPLPVPAGSAPPPSTARERRAAGAARDRARVVPASAAPQLGGRGEQQAERARAARATDRERQAIATLATPKASSPTAAAIAVPASPPAMICCIPVVAQLSGSRPLIQENGPESACVGRIVPVEASCTASRNSEITRPARPRPIVSR